MSCDLTKGRTEKCKDSIGGIKKVFFANGVVGYTEDVDDIITDINDGDAIPAAITLYEYETKDVSSLEETINTDRATGTTFFEQVVNLTLKKLDAETRKELKLMAYGSFTIFVMDNNDNLLMIGKDRGADCTGGTIVSGTALGDLSGYTINFTGREIAPANFLTPGTTKTDASYPFDNMTTPPTIVKGT